MGAAIRLRNAAFHRRCVQLGIGVGRVTVAGATAAKHHVAAGYRALVHFAQMNGRKVNFQRTLIAESFHTNVALDSLLAGGGTDKRDAQIIGQLAALVAAIVG